MFPCVSLQSLLFMLPMLVCKVLLLQVGGPRQALMPFVLSFLIVVLYTWIKISSIQFNPYFVSAEQVANEPKYAGLLEAPCLHFFHAGIITFSLFTVRKLITNTDITKISEGPMQLHYSQVQLYQSDSEFSSLLVKNLPYVLGTFILHKAIMRILATKLAMSNYMFEFITYIKVC